MYLGGRQLKAKNKALLHKFKIPAFIAATSIFVSIPFTIVSAESGFLYEEGIAGIAETLDRYHESANGDQEDNKKDIVKILESKIISPYQNLGVSKANNYVNIRTEPSTESEVVGKLYRGCATDILEWLDDGWVRIKSGDVEGYIALEYLATGRDAEEMFDEYATRYATVTGTATLRVREEQSIDSKTLELIPEGETFIIVNLYDEWAEILLGSEGQGEDFTGFVHRDYIEEDIVFNYAISIEEEERIKREQEAAERAERERLERLAQEEAERKEAERKAAEERKRKEAEKKSENNKPAPSTGGGSGTGAEIAKYAQNFVGNPYVWGGTSLTKGADCSGFVYTIYKQHGYSLPRTSRDQAARAGVQVNISDRRPGDLLFYTNSSGTVNHVAMYIGNDKIVHAANSRQGIIISNYNYRKVYRARRIVN